MKTIEDIAKYCVKMSQDFVDERNTKIISVGELVLDSKGKVRTRNDLSPLKELAKKVVYGFYDAKGKPVYIGQAGEGCKTILMDRIGQELRPYKKTKKGDNGGTLSKKLQEETGKNFRDPKKFKRHIKKWTLRILSSDSFEVSTELIEQFLIQWLQPKLNRLR